MTGQKLFQLQLETEKFGSREPPSGLQALFVFRSYEHAAGAIKISPTKRPAWRLHSDHVHQATPYENNLNFFLHDGSL
jgi:hypothetical protein